MLRKGSASLLRAAHAVEKFAHWGQSKISAQVKFILAPMTLRALLALLVMACVPSPASVAQVKLEVQPKPAAKPSKPAPEPLGESLCPALVHVEQSVTAVPGGWEARQSDAKPQLALVTFYEGPPAERASLKYDSELKQKRDWVATWTLAPNARGYWIECAYDHTTATLARRLPADATTCTVIYERRERTTAGLPVIRHVGCK